MIEKLNKEHMKYTFLSSLDDDGIKSVINSLNESEGDITIVVDSEGGSLDIMYLLLDIVNDNSERITLLGAQISSSAFDLFLMASCKKRLSQSAYACIHRTHREIKYTGPSRGVGHKNSFQMDWIENNQLDMTDILTADELVEYDKGNEVYLGYNRLCSILSIQQHHE